MSDWQTATVEPARTCKPLSDRDHETIAYMYQDNRPLSDIERAIERSHGTVTTALRRLRVAGVVGRRRG